MAVDLKAIEQLAPDQAALKAAAGLAKPAKWSNLGISDDATLIWGACAGSGANPYRVMADTRDLGNKCTCPSRKFPCKHVLALFWLNAEGLAPFVCAQAPEWVSEWLGRRRTGGANRPPAIATPTITDKDMAAARQVVPEPVIDEQAAARRETAGIKRTADTHRAITDALDALELWVADQLRLGLGSFIADVTARCRQIGARLTDGKAAALAGHVDELPARLLELPAEDRVRGATVELGRLVLLARAFRAEPHLPELRRMVAAAENRETLLADPATVRINSMWEVLAEHVRTRRDGLVSQTTWLLNLGPVGPRFAMLLDFFPASTGRRGSVFVPGEQFAGELAFYRARAPLRAVVLGHEAGGADRLTWPQPAGSLTEMLTAPWLHEPWAEVRPVLLPAGRIGFDRAGSSWWRGADGDMVLPLAGDVSGLATGTDLTASAALWSGGRLQMLAACTRWGRIDG